MEDWLISEQTPVGTGTDAMNTPSGPPTTDMTMGAIPPQQTTVPKQNDPNITNVQNQQQKPVLPDVAEDPQTPDMPKQVEKEEVNFETWKKNYLVASIKGNVEELKELINKVRDDDLDPYQHKFVEDNLQILFLREYSNIDKASNEIRRKIKEDLDHNNPGTSVVNHITSVLETVPLLNNCFIKLTGLLSMKADIHRKFIASLLGAVQVGSGATNEDLIFNERDYSIRISTRFNSRFGDIHLGNWSLKTDDPERYLKQPELKRLEDGSPEEKDVLRRRVVMESIAAEFKTRAFIVNVVGTDGTIYSLGWDLATSLKSAYTEGKLVVRTKQDDSSEAMIDDDGAIIPFVDLKIMYTKTSEGEYDEEGKPIKKEIEFMTRRYGQLFLTASLEIIKDAANSFQGIVLKETPWQGAATDLKTLARCVPSTNEIILRTC